MDRCGDQLLKESLRHEGLHAFRRFNKIHIDTARSIRVISKAISTVNKANSLVPSKSDLSYLSECKDLSLPSVKNDIHFLMPV